MTQQQQLRPAVTPVAQDSAALELDIIRFALTTARVHQVTKVSELRQRIAAAFPTAEPAAVDSSLKMLARRLTEHEA